MPLYLRRTHTLFCLPHIQIAKPFLNIFEKLRRLRIRTISVYLIYNYYYRFLIEITGSNSKILRAYFRITPKDWLNLSFSDAYFFEGQYWRLNQISDYNPIEDGVYLCEFLLQQFIEPATIVQKTIGAGTAGQTDAESDIYPGGNIPIKPGIKGELIKA